VICVYAASNGFYFTITTHLIALKMEEMQDGSQAHAGEPPHPTTPPAEDNAENDQQSASNTPRAAQRESVTKLADQLEEQSISNQSQEPEAEPESEGELSSFEWDELQSRFGNQMQAQTDEEHKIQGDLLQLMNVSISVVHTEPDTENHQFYVLWQQVSQHQEQERCAKR